MRKTLLAIGLAAAVSGGSRVQAQAYSPPTARPGTVVNPYTNPYTNPYLNPYLYQRPAGLDPALVQYLAIQRTTGIGTGALLTAQSATTPKPPAEMPRSAMRPGGGAARYFGQPAGPTNRRPYYQRHDRYFGSNGR